MVDVTGAPSQYGVNPQAFARWAEEKAAGLLSAVAVVLHTARSLNVTVDGATFRMPVGTFSTPAGLPPLEAVMVPGDSRVYVRRADGRPEVWAVMVL